MVLNQCGEQLCQHAYHKWQEDSSSYYEGNRLTIASTLKKQGRNDIIHIKILVNINQGKYRFHQSVMCIC